MAKDKAVVSLSCDVQQSQYVELDPVTSKVVRGSVSDGSGWIRLAVVFVTVAFIALTATGLLMYNHMIRTHDQRYIFKEKTVFRDIDYVDVEQHTESSLTDNYVMYHVIKPFEQTWIVDDFKQRLQLMKIERHEADSVCYVTSLNHTTATSPKVFSTPWMHRQKRDVQQRIQTVYMASEMPVTDLSMLGRHGLHLCTNLPVFWIHPLNGNSDLESPAHDDSTYTNQRSREKRNVKKCKTSCCTMVCCCNQRWLQWQSDHTFNCNNVCSGCSEKSNMEVNKVC